MSKILGKLKKIGESLKTKTKTKITNENIRNLVQTYDRIKNHNWSWEALPVDLQGKSIEEWDVSEVTDMSYLFSGCHFFNEPLNGWNVSNVVNMHGMFSGLTNFNQPLNSWITSKVENMSSMFSQTLKFNQDLNTHIEDGIVRWDVSNVKNMAGMFSNTESFNGSLADWDISNVVNMDYMLSQSRRFNNDSLSTWTRPKIIPRNVSFEFFFYNTPLYRFINNPEMRAKVSPRWLTKIETEKENEIIEKKSAPGRKFLQEFQNPTKTDFSSSKNNINSRYEIDGEPNLNDMPNPESNIDVINTNVINNNNNDIDNDNVAWPNQITTTDKRPIDSRTMIEGEMAPEPPAFLEHDNRADYLESKIAKTPNIREWFNKYVRPDLSESFLKTRGGKRRPRTRTTKRYRKNARKTNKRIKRKTSKNRK